MSDWIEIRWHGRGGQGVVTAGKLLAETAMGSGQYFQAFPAQGAPLAIKWKPLISAVGRSLHRSL